MILCPVCKKVEIDEKKYKQCADCFSKSKGSSQDELVEVLRDIEKVLTFQNWNLGSLVMLLKGDKETLKKIEDDMKKANEKSKL